MAAAFGSWLVTPQTAFGPLGLLFFLIFGAGFVVSAYLSGPSATRLVGDPVAGSLLTRRATAGMIVFGAGLFILGMRFLQIDALPFGWPLWLVGSAVIAAIYLVQCLRRWRSGRASQRV